MMPISDPRDRFFCAHHTPIEDTYSFAYGLNQLTLDTKSDVSYLLMSLMHSNKKLTFGVGHHTMLQ